MLWQTPRSFNALQLKSRTLWVRWQRLGHPRRAAALCLRWPHRCGSCRAQALRRLPIACHGGNESMEFDELVWSCLMRPTGQKLLEQVLELVPVLVPAKA